MSDIRRFFQPKSANAKETVVKPVEKTSRRSAVVLSSSEDEAPVTKPLTKTPVATSLPQPTATNKLTDASSYFGNAKPTRSATSVVKPPVKKSPASTRVLVESDEDVTMAWEDHEQLLALESSQKLSQSQTQSSPVKPATAKRQVAVVEDDDDEPFVHAGKRKLATKPPSPAKKVAAVTPATQSPVQVASSSKALTPAAVSPQKSPASLVPSAAPATVPATTPTAPKFNYQQYMQKRSEGPAAPGSKPIPEGRENCFMGLTFVFTGEMESTSRDVATDLVKRYGGRVTTAPSRKTSYVVVGHDAGPKKLEKIKELKLTLLDEDAFLELIATLPARNEDGSLKTETKSVETISEKKKSPLKASKSLPAVTTATTPVTESLPRSQTISSESETVPASGVATELWTEKYRPTKLSEIVGNKGLVQKLIDWLRAWDTNLQRGFKGNFKEDPNMFRAVLISGPPGIGKSTAATVASRESGYEVLEFNASDARSKKSLDSAIKELTGNQTVKEFFKSTDNAADASSSSSVPAVPEKRKQVIIMDEVDGMSSGDRGGMAELILLIKKSKTPIICICNDRSSPKVRSLSNYCLDLRFRRPEAQQIRSRILTVAFREQLKIPANCIDQLVESTQNDIRQILNILSTWRTNRDSMNYDDAKQIGSQSKKDVAIGIFDLTMNLLSQQEYVRTSLEDRLNYYFYDYAMVPLMIQENYLRSRPFMAKSETDVMHLISKAADAMADSDVVSERIRGADQSWSLAPLHGLMSCVLPGYWMRGSVSGRIDFAGWLGKNSQQGKFTRMLKELNLHSRLHLSADKESMRLHYVPSFVELLMRPLLQAQPEVVVQLLDAYTLTKDDFESLLELTIGPNSGTQLMQNVPSQVKASLTRLYNKTVHKTPYSLGGSVSKGTGGAAASSMFMDEEMEPEPVEDEEEEEDGNDDDLTKDKMIKQKVAKKTAAASAAKPKATRGGKAAGTARGSNKRKKDDFVVSDSD